MEAWNQYHDFISIAKSKVIKEFNRGAYYDIHGNTMSTKVMLGYLLRKTDYEAGIQVIQEKLNQSSIRSIIEQQTTNESKIELLIGKESLGGLLEKYGIGSVPLGLKVPYDWFFFFQLKFFFKKLKGEEENIGMVVIIQKDMDQL